MSTARRIQMHPSAEPITVPASVDLRTMSENSGAGTGSFQGASVRSTANISDTRDVPRIQLHPSEEPVLLDTSVDQRARVSDQPSVPPLDSGDNQNSPLFTTPPNESFALQGHNAHVSRRLQFQSSVEQVSVPSSIDVRPDAVPDAVQDESIERDCAPQNPRSDLNEGYRERNSAQGAVVDLSSEEEAESVRASKAREIDGVYTFLFRMTVKALRGLLKDMKVKQSEEKEVLLARVLVSADIRLIEGESLTNIMESYRVTSRFGSWRKHQIAIDEKVPQYFLIAPSVTHAVSLLDAAEAESFTKVKTDVLRSGEGLTSAADQGQQTTNASRAAGENEQSPNLEAERTAFSINEFARLCIIIRDDEDAKAVLLATGKELTRCQMDAGFTRDSFWGVIEGRYNDPELRLHLNMVGNVDDIDSTITPPTHRTASFLKEKFFDARSSFAVCVENWSKSGQNNNSGFKQFAGTRNNELTAAGKRDMVLFVCARMGTENEDTRFRRMCSRVIPNGGGVDEGGPEFQREEERFHRRPGRTSSRRDSSYNSGADNDSGTRSIAQLSQFLIQRGRERDEEKRSWYEEKRQERRERRQQRREQHDEMREVAAERRERKRRKSDGNLNGLKQLEEHHKLIKLLRYATETLQSQGQDPGAELVIATKKHKEALFKALRMPQGTPQDLHTGFSLDGDERDDIPGSREEGREVCRSRERSGDDPVSEVRSREEDEILPN